MLIFYGILFVIWGLILFFARDFAWDLTVLANRWEGDASERTDVWDFRASLGGFISIGVGVFLIALGISTLNQTATYTERISTYEFIGLEEGYQAEVVSIIDTTLATASGPQRLVDKLDKAHRRAFRATLDLTGLGPGIHKVKPEATLISGSLRDDEKQKLELKIGALSGYLEVEVSKITFINENQLSSLEGLWLGGLEPRKAEPPSRYFELSFYTYSTEADGTAVTQPEGEEVALELVELDGQSIQFKILDESEPLQFSGILQEDKISGESEERRFEFFKVVDGRDLGEWHDWYSGVYQLETGETFSIFSDLKANRLRYVNYTNGEVRTLYPLSEVSFFTGSAQGMAYPVGNMITFDVADGVIEGLYINPTNEEPEYAERLPVFFEDVQFQSGDDILAGTFTRPPGAGPFPTIILAHPSNGALRSDKSIAPFVHFFVEQGFAALAYDKRGYGESEGSPISNSGVLTLEVLADDLKAAAQYMASRTDVDQNRLGVMGIDQSSWFAPLAASQSDKIRFLILISGSGVMQSEESFYRELVNEGDSTITLTEEELYERMADAPTAGFDPLLYIDQLAIPGLWLFGGADQSHPVPLSVGNILAIGDLRNHDFTVIVLEDGDHSIFSTSGASTTYPAYLNGYVPNLFEEIQTWLIEQKIIAVDKSP